MNCRQMRYAPHLIWQSYYKEGASWSLNLFTIFFAVIAVVPSLAFWFTLSYLLFEFMKRCNASQPFYHKIHKCDPFLFPIGSLISHFSFNFGHLGKHAYYSTLALSLCLKNAPSVLKLMDSSNGFDFYCIGLSSIRNKGEIKTKWASSSILCERAIVYWLQWTWEDCICNLNPIVILSFSFQTNLRGGPRTWCVENVQTLNK